MAKTIHVRGDVVPRRQCESLEPRRMMRGGDLDTSFNGTGYASVSVSNIFGNSAEVDGQSIAVQSSGKILVAGTTGASEAIVRYNIDGTVDKTFGPDGNGLILGGTSGGGATFAINAITVQSDDKIIIVGHVGSSTNTKPQQLSIQRLNADGTSDPTFNGGHGAIDVLNVDGDSPSEATAVTVQNDGKIVVAGYAEASSFEYEFALIRLNTDGSYDTSFDGNGQRTFNFGGSDKATSVAIDYSGTSSTNPFYGTIVVGGTHTASLTNTDTQFAIARVTAGGNLDNDFSNDGRVLSSFVSEDTLNKLGGLAIQSTGKIVVEGAVGTTNSQGKANLGVFRLNADGGGDSTFGVGNGQIQITYPTVFLKPGNVVIGESGSILIASDNGSQIKVSCLTSEGQLDTAYGTSGTATLTHGSAGAAVIARYAGGTLLVAGANSLTTNRILDRAPDTVSIGTLNPYASESGPTSIQLLVTRLERDSTPLRVYLSISGTANAPGNAFHRPIDYTGTNIQFGNALQANDPTYVDILANQTYTTVTITPVDDALVEGDETAVFTVIQKPTIYDSGTNPVSTIVIRDNDQPAPAVTSTAFQYETLPQTATFKFNEDVGPSLSASDFTVTGPHGNVAFALTYDNVNDLATLAFNTPLPDGNYTATAIGAGITNSSGVAMPGNALNGFFMLGGDANHDRTVDFTDLLTLAKNYGQSGLIYSDGDFDYSGTVDFSDLLILAKNYNATLPAAASATASPTFATRHRAAEDLLA